MMPPLATPHPALELNADRALMQGVLLNRCLEHASSLGFQASLHVVLTQPARVEPSALGERILRPRVITRDHS